MATPIAEPPHLAADLKTLCLSTVASQWRPLAEQAARQRQAPADYLAQLAHLEVTGRRERRIQRRIQDARFQRSKRSFHHEGQGVNSAPHKRSVATGRCSQPLSAPTSFPGYPLSQQWRMTVQQ